MNKTSVCLYFDGRFHSNPFVLIMFRAGGWLHPTIKNVDIIRMQIACDILDLRQEEHIFNVGINTFGKNVVATHK